MNVYLLMKNIFQKFQRTVKVDSKYNFTIFTLNSYHTEQIFCMKY